MRHGEHADPHRRNENGPAVPLSSELLLADRHYLPLSIALHLVPAGLIVGAYLLIAEALVKAIGYPIFSADAARRPSVGDRIDRGARAGSDRPVVAGPQAKRPVRPHRFSEVQARQIGVVLHKTLGYQSGVVEGRIRTMLGEGAMDVLGPDSRFADITNW